MIMTKNMNQMLKQFNQMQSKMNQLQKELDDRELLVESAGGRIKVKINGKQKILDLEISGECILDSDPELLQEMIKVAMNQAIEASQEMVNKAMNKLTHGMDLPGF
jgi:DNA-binding YbaB/EbfC family protein